jgi:acetyl/propionyl-CoA carboxylase alpha subunit
LRAIDDYHIVGVRNTLPFGKFVLNHPNFVNGNFDTHFVDKFFKPEYLNEDSSKELSLVSAIAADYFFYRQSPNHSNKSSANIKSSNWFKNRR